MDKGYTVQRSCMEIELGGRRSETPESIGRHGTRDHSGVSNVFMDSYSQKADKRHGIFRCGKLKITGFSMMKLFMGRYLGESVGNRQA